MLTCIGGASGIGRLVAHRMSKLGSTIVICDVNEKGMADVAQEITSAGGKAYFISKIYSL